MNSATNTKKNNANNKYLNCSTHVQVCNFVVNNISRRDNISIDAYTMLFFPCLIVTIKTFDGHF